MREWDWLIDMLEKRSEVPEPAHPEASVPRASADQDSEYEYEYDESEPESFYVNVDLNSSGWLGKVQEPAAYKAAVPTTEQLDISESVQPPDETIFASPLTRSRSRPSQIQVVDLHKDRPLVKYQKQVFECRWADMIGTDLLILPANADFKSPILMECEGLKESKGIEYPGFKVVAANSVKLISQKLMVSEKHDESEQPDADEETDDFHIPQDATENRRNQTEFLKHFTAIKRAHGDSDKVPRYSQRALNATRDKPTKDTPGPEPDTGQYSTKTESQESSSVQAVDEAIQTMQASIDGDSHPPGAKRQKASERIGGARTGSSDDPPNMAMAPSNVRRLLKSQYPRLP